MGGSWTLTFPGRPPLLNAERSGHWRTHRETTRLLREQAGWEARRQRIPRLREITVKSWPTYRDRRSWPDVAAWVPATKAVIDGLVDVGVLTDDGPDVVTESTFLPPALDHADGLVVVITALETGHGRLELTDTGDH